MPESPRDTRHRDWRPVATISELEETDRKIVEIDGESVGIFKVNGYVVKAKLSATFADGKGIAVPAPRQPNGRVTCEAPTLYVALGDARGIRRAEMTLDGAPAPIRPGTENAAHARGFHVAVDPAFASGAAPLRAELVIERKVQ